MMLSQVWKTGLAVMFACTLTIANVGCDGGKPAPAPVVPSEGGEETPVGEEGSVVAPAGEAVPE